MPPGATTVTPLFEEVLTALVLLGLLVIAGLVWAWVIRRAAGQRLQVIRQREKALEDHYRELFENAHDILFTLDEAGRLLTLNQAGERMMGLAGTEAARVRFEDRLIPKDREPFRAALAHLRAGELVPATELTLDGGEGRRTVLRVDLRLHHPGGGPPRVQGIAWDITPQKEAEQALRESEARLRRSLEERVRLGRDLHDGIIQSLYALGLGLNEARKLAGHRPQEAESRLKSGIQDVNRIIREVREFIEGLDASPVGPVEFREVLRTLVASAARDGGPQLELEVEDSAFDRLAPGQSVQLLQCAREAVSNSLRHAHARHIRVSLRSGAAGARLRVQDDGTGFEPQAPAGRGRGLANMESRSVELGGRLVVESKPEAGTVVELEVPAGN